MSYLESLNPAQHEAVINYQGPSLVIAGAGSGKTRVLTYRIAYLMEQGVAPGSIMALTFTNKAAREMKERIAMAVGSDTARRLWVGTFHSLFSRILRQESEALGYSSNFTIYDSQDSKSVIKKIVKDLKLSDKVYKPGEIASRISFAKNNLLTPAAYNANTQIMESDRKSQKPMMADIYQRYANRCKSSDAMDFDDLLLYTNILFRDHPDILTKYQSFYKYLLVDEYQDTNFSQYLIIKKLAEQHQNLCVVGDDAQSIYSFRGARIENILNFKNDYPNYKLFKLEQNYRSTQTIVNAANSLIAKNKGQIPKKVFSENDEGALIKILKTSTDKEEGFYISNILQEVQTRTNAPYTDFAILYRTNAQSRIFEEALRNKNIPYRVYGSISFYQRKEIKDVLAYCRLTINSNDLEAFKRVVNYPARGIGATTLDRLEGYANINGIRIWDLLANLEMKDVGLNKGTIAKLKKFYHLIEDFKSKAEQMDAFEIANHIAHASGIIADLKAENLQENITRFENVVELLNSVKEFTSNQSENQKVLLTTFMENVALLTDADEDQPELKNSVSLMTVHASKGLEFGNVFVVGMEENLFPSSISLSTEQDIEEERRLFYVAITRAKEKAIVSFAGTRYKWGELTWSTPSRFLKELDPMYVELPADFFENAPAQESKGQTNWSNQNKLNVFQQPKPQLQKINTAMKQAPSSVLSGEDIQKITLGTQVMHDRFGKGKVSRLEGDFPNQKATVEFEGSGPRQLLLKFAKLKVIG